MNWYAGSIYYFDLISSVFEPTKRDLWDDVKYITSTGWTVYSETDITSDEHLDRIAKLGISFHQIPLSGGLDAEYWREYWRN